MKHILLRSLILELDVYHFNTVGNSFKSRARECRLNRTNKPLMLLCLTQ